MSFRKTSAKFRSRAKVDAEEEDEDDGVQVKKSVHHATKDGTRPAKAMAGAEIAKKSGPLLSFTEDEYEEGVSATTTLKTKKKALLKEKKSLRKAAAEIEAEDVREATVSGAGSYGALAGEYTAEKLAALRNDQHFAVSTKTRKETVGQTKVTFMHPDGQDAALIEDISQVDEQHPGPYSEQEVRRLKEKRTRNRKEGMEEFIPLHGREPDEHRVEAYHDGGLDLQQESSLVHDADVEKDWESQMIRRGAHKPDTVAGNGLHPVGYRIAEGFGLPTLIPRGAEAAGKTVESVLKDLKDARARIGDAHERDVRAEERLHADVKVLKEGMDKARQEFDETAERFEFFQEIREYISILCGCLREKNVMIQELGQAILTVRREALERRLARRVQDQEEALEELKEKGFLLSTQSYRPQLKSLSDIPREKARIELDEFGRDSSHVEAGARDRRRRERRARQEKVRRRLGAAVEDVIEAEATLSDAEDSDTERAVVHTRQSKLLEAAAVIFEDVEEDYHSLDYVARRFELWKRAYPKDYTTAYVSVGLPQVFEPYIRLELIRWEPLSSAAGNVVHSPIEGLQWFHRLFVYGQNSRTGGEEEDLDEQLIPTLVERVVVPLLGESIKSSYDAHSARDTVKAVAAIQAILTYKPSNAALEHLLPAALHQLQRAVQMTCIPLLRLTADPQALSFQWGQICRAIKLLSNILYWKTIFSASALLPLAIGDLLDKIMAPALEDRLGKSCEQAVLLEILASLQAALSVIPPSYLRNSVQVPNVLRLLSRLSKAAEGGTIDSVMSAKVANLKAVLEGPSS